MAFYDETQLLYLEPDASGIRLRAALLQARSIRPITFASKGLSSAERRYSHIEREALGILHGLKKFHHYCFVTKVTIITDHKLLVAIFKKDVAMLSQRIQWILLRIQQYRVSIIYKPGSNLVKAYWLSRQNHKKSKDEEISGMQLNVDAIQTTTNTPDCMMMQQLQQAISRKLPATAQRLYHQRLTTEQRSNTTRHVNILDILRWYGTDQWGYTQRQTCSNTWVMKKQWLKQLHVNHMGIQKTKLMVHA